MLPAARLVCEPRNFNKLDLGGGDDQEAFVYSEYRFRVVCIYQVPLPIPAIKLDVFCSESGEWTKEALVCDDHVRTGSKSVVSCNGELFWKYIERHGDPLKAFLAVFNPFRLHMPPTSIDVSAFLVYPHWFISASQGVLHVIAIENRRVPVRSRIWRLKEDGKSWRKQCEGLMNETSKCCNYVVEGCYRPFLHPHKPEIVFFNPLRSEEKNALLCCDLRTEELEVFAKVEEKPDVCRLQVFQPRVSCWATPIPRYEELRCMHDGSYSFWVQSSSEAKTHSLPASLNICMDEVVKLAFFKDYITNVTGEETWDIVSEIIQQRKNKINEIVLRESWTEDLKHRLLCETLAKLPYPPVSIKSVCTTNMVVPSRKRKLGGMATTEKKQPRFADDKEADFKDVASYVAAVGEPKELEQGLLCETSAELPHPLVPIKRQRGVFRGSTVTLDILPHERQATGRLDL